MKLYYIIYSSFVISFLKYKNRYNISIIFFSIFIDLNFLLHESEIPINNSIKI